MLPPQNQILPGALFKKCPFSICSPIPVVEINPERIHFISLMQNLHTVVYLCFRKNSYPSSTKFFIVKMT
jgi:hypothetical protein